MPRTSAALRGNPFALINYSTDRGRSTYKARWSIRYGARLGIIASLIAEDDFSFLKVFFREQLKILTKKMPDLKLSNYDLIWNWSRKITLDCNELRVMILLCKNVSVMSVCNASYIVQKDFLLKDAYRFRRLKYSMD